MLRKVLALIAALVANIAVVTLGEVVAHRLVPFTVDPSDAASVASAMDRAPFAALLLVGVSWLLGAFAASCAAWFVSRKAKGFAMLGTVWTLAGVIVSVSTIPHPLWLAALGLLGPVVAGLMVPRLFPARPA